MPFTFENLTLYYAEAIQRQREALEIRRAQSERVGPSFLGLPDWYREGVEPIRMADMYPNRYTATAGTIRTSNEARPPITAQMFEDLARRFSARQPESAPQAQGGRMRFSAKQTPLNDTERARMRTFFSQVLRDGKASYPLTNNRLIVFSGGVGKFIYRDNCWSMSGEYIYIGHMSDEGTGELSDPAARLALTVALMALCDLQSDPELLQLVEQRLAKILAGVYEGAIAPLAERTNGEPVSRIAWSTTGGVAAFVDGQWTSPVTGEAVAVGEGWVVVETGEGRKAESSPAANGLSQITSEDGEQIMAEFTGSGNYHVETLPDGRTWARYETGNGSIDAAREISDGGFYGRLIAHRHPDGRWGITYPLPPSPIQEVEPIPF